MVARDVFCADFYTENFSIFCSIRFSGRISRVVPVFLPKSDSAGIGDNISKNQAFSLE